MMGELVAVFKGDLRVSVSMREGKGHYKFPVFMEPLIICSMQKSTVCDYLQILLKLAGANETTKFMAYYLSEMVLLHTKFGR